MSPDPAFPAEPERTRQLAEPSRARVYEVSPRDGLQNEATIVPTERKAELIARLVAAGVRDIEVTSFVRPRWIPQLSDAAELVSLLPQVEGVNYWGLVPNPVGLERALEARMRGVGTVLSASETHNKKNLNRTVRESLAGLEELIPVAKDEGLRVRSYISTVFGCPYEGHVAPEATLTLAERLLAAGCDELVLGDTVGMANPVQVEAMIALLLQHGVRIDQIAVHFHDTRGTALANALVALRAGVTTFDASIAGLGGCPYAPGAAGNLASEDLVQMFEAMGVSTGVDLDRLADAGHYAQGVLGRELSGRYHQYHAGRSDEARRRAAARNTA
ncbi:MAG: hydroxymethylglutaryl-CoA lyase [Myxococcales bacterium]|nr:hydroxymethylglutaryl-CoA lyase [Myxococcales bacterium]